MKKIPVQQLSPRQLVLPLALCQFIASYACTNMNVAISDIAKDLNTTVIGVQTAITLFTLTMAALMIPGSKLSDLWGRKFCFMLGLIVYGAGAVIAAAAPVLLLSKERADLRCLIIGEGPERRGLEAQAARLGLQGIEFSDFVPEHDGLIATLKAPGHWCCRQNGRASAS